VQQGENVSSPNDVFFEFFDWVSKVEMGVDEAVMALTLRLLYF